MTQITFQVQAFWDKGLNVIVDTNELAFALTFGVDSVPQLKY
jgi:plasmid replication initiation protein